MTEFKIDQTEAGTHYLYENGEVVEANPCPEVIPEGDPVLFDVVDGDGCKPIEDQVHRRLYDHHQCNHTFEQGDTITFDHGGYRHFYEVNGVHVHYRGMEVVGLK
jgi:hypothetical protein